MDARSMRENGVIRKRNLPRQPRYSSHSPMAYMRAMYSTVKMTTLTISTPSKIAPGQPDGRSSGQ